MSTPDFRLKGSTVTVVVLDLLQFDPEGFSAQLRERIDQAPSLFQGSPVVIALEGMAEEARSKLYDLLPHLLSQCREAGLRPIALRGVDPDGEAQAAATGLAVLPAASGRERRDSLAQRFNDEAPAAPGPAAEAPAAGGSESVQGAADPAAQDKAPPTSAPNAAAARPTRTITHPVRSGQQIYAEGGDLIVLSQVSEGAEVLADGNIHIYGALRGRALAGVHGDTSARIFCQQMDAELVSVAGNFLLSDAITSEVHRKAVQVTLEGDSLRISPLATAK